MRESRWRIAESFVQPLKIFADDPGQVPDLFLGGHPKTGTVPLGKDPGMKRRKRGKGNKSQKVFTLNHDSFLITFFLLNHIAQGTSPLQIIILDQFFCLKIWLV